MQPEYFSLTKEPFADQPDPDLFFPEAKRAALLRRIYADIQNGSAVICLLGAEGTGKTMLCQMLARLLPDTFQPILLEYPGGSFDELLQAVLVQLGAEPDQDVAAELESLVEQCQRQGTRLLLFVDQAEKMFPAALERLFRTAFAAQGSHAFQVILAGRPALDERIKQLISYCADIDSPPAHTVQPLTEEETGAYLSFCLKAAGLAAAGQAFSQEAVRKIFAQAQGNLRQTNQLAAQALQQLCDGKRQLPVQKSDVPLLHKEAGNTGKATVRSGRLMQLFTLAALLLLAALLFRYNEALWQNGWEQVQSLFGAGSAEPKKLLPIPKELQFNSEEEMPPVPESAPEEKIAAAEQESAPQAAEEIQNNPDKAPSQDLPPATEAAPAEQVLPSVAEAEEETAQAAESEPREEQAVLEEQNQTEDILPEEPLVTPAELSRVDEENHLSSLQELTPDTQKKIIYLFPGMKKTKVPLPEIKPEPQAPQVQTQEPEPPAAAPVPAPEPEEAAVSETAPPDANMLYQELHYAGSRLRSSVNADKYTLQLLLLSSSDAAAKIKQMIVREEYLDHKQQLKILRKQTMPTALFMFYGLYNSEAEAKQALDTLPLFLRKHHPYILSVKEALKKTAYLY